MIQLLAGGKAIAFLGGAVVGAVAVPVLKSKTVRKVAVSTLATGLSAKEHAERTWGTVQENLSDLYEEAKSKKSEKDSQDFFSTLSDYDIDWSDDPFEGLEDFLGSDNDLNDDAADLDDDDDDLT